LKRELPKKFGGITNSRFPPEEAGVEAAKGAWVEA